MQQLAAPWLAGNGAGLAGEALPAFRSAGRAGWNEGGNQCIRFEFSGLSWVAGDTRMTIMGASRRQPRAAVQKEGGTLTMAVPVGAGT